MRKIFLVFIVYPIFQISQISPILLIAGLFLAFALNGCPPSGAGINLDSSAKFRNLPLAELPIESERDAIYYVVHSDFVLEEMEKVEKSTHVSSWSAMARKSSWNTWEVYLNSSSAPSLRCTFLINKKGKYLKSDNPECSYK